MRVFCTVCSKRCKGEVLKFGDKYMHYACFRCHVCKVSLDQNQVFFHDKYFYCKEHYCKLVGIQQNNANNSNNNKQLPSNGQQQQKPQQQQQNLQVEIDFANASSRAVKGPVAQSSPGSCSNASDLRSQYAQSMWAGSYLHIQEDIELRMHPNDRYKRPNYCRVFAPQLNQRHFHLPRDRQRSRAVSQASSLNRSSQKSPSRRSHFTVRTRSSRANSPMPDDDPVLNSVYPGAAKPDASKPAPVERDDWPAPAFFDLMPAYKQRKQQQQQQQHQSRQRSSSSSSSKVEQRLAEGSIDVGQLGAALLEDLKQQEKQQQQQQEQEQEQQQQQQQQENEQRSNGHADRQSLSENEASTEALSADQVQQVSNGQVANGHCQSAKQSDSYHELFGLRPTGLSRLNYAHLLKGKQRKEQPYQHLLKPRAV